MTLRTAYIQVLAMFYGQATYSELWFIMCFFCFTTCVIVVISTFEGKKQILVWILYQLMKHSYKLHRHQYAILEYLKHSSGQHSQFLPTTADIKFNRIF